MTDPIHRLGRLGARIGAALLVAGGVTLVAAGLLAYTGPEGGLGAGGTSTPTNPASTGRGSSSPTSSADGSPSATPTASGQAGSGVPTRVVVPALRIDLGVYPSDYPGGVSYPLCDVAQYFVPTASNAGEKLGLPGQVGHTVYIYAHARVGMFLPILTQSLTANGAAMLGDVVQVYTSDGWEYLYEVFQVKRHTRDFTLAGQVGTDAQWLILQTSEGPNYTYPKLQIAADLLTVQPADPTAIKPSTTPAPVCPGN